VEAGRTHGIFGIVGGADGVSLFLVLVLVVVLARSSLKAPRGI
jgi:hypothetical protein